ncbi:MAG: hypothetical protein R3F38_16510 [Gammaproteobacteria bacterium]
MRYHDSATQRRRDPAATCTFTRDEILKHQRTAVVSQFSNPHLGIGVHQRYEAPPCQQRAVKRNIPRLLSAISAALSPPPVHWPAESQRRRALIHMSANEQTSSPATTQGAIHRNLRYPLLNLRQQGCHDPVSSTSFLALMEHTADCSRIQILGDHFLVFYLHTEFFFRKNTTSEYRWNR